MKKAFLILSSLLALPLTPSFAQSIEVTAAGVGVGTATPSAVLHVKQPGTSFLPEVSLARFDYYNGRYVQILGPLTDGSTAPFTIKTNNSLQFRIDSTDAFVITGTGNTVTSGSATVGSLIVGSSTIFSEGQFTSSEKSIPGTYETLTVAHGMGGIPRFTTVALRCKTAEQGWTAGDEILLNSLSMISNNHGVTTAVNATNFKLIQYGNIYIHSFTTGAPFVITPANWRLVFRAWR